MKYLILITIFIFFISSVYAQFSVQKCGTDESYYLDSLKDVAFVSNQKKIKQFTEKFIKSGGSKNLSKQTINQPVIIPVVVHVLWNSLETIISKEQVVSQITALNKDFNLLNEDAYLTPSVFLDRRANCQITFCLAKRDPDGNPTNGIILKQTTNKYFSNLTDDAKISLLGGDNPWDRDKYLNIWVVPKLLNVIGQEILGDASFPGGLAATDGVVIGYKYFGTLGTATFPNHLGRTTTHEVGHWLNLKHIWGGATPSCEDSDEVDDTPNQLFNNVDLFYEAQNPYHLSPFIPKISCNNEPNGEMFMNFMDYTQDAGLNMFTLGQKDRMYALFQPGGARNSLLSSSACDGLPDLIVEEPDVVPSYLNSGDTCSLKFSVRNQGSEIAGKNYVNIHLSQDNVLTPGLNGDIFLDQFFVDQVIDPFSKTTVFTKNIRIPQSVLPGTYYIFFAADGTDTVLESDNSNNFATATISISDVVSQSYSSYRYWFDNNFLNSISVSLPTGNSLVEVQSKISTAALRPGLHTFNLHFKNINNKWSSISSSIFYKVNTEYPTGSAQYEYWFDNFFTRRTTTNINNLNSLILVENFNSTILNDGLHALYVRFKPKGKQWSSIITNFFYKNKDVLIPINNLSKYIYWYDDDWSNPKTISIIGQSNISWNLNTDAITLSEGRHKISMMFKDDRDKWSSIVSDSFTKHATSRYCLTGTQRFFSNISTGNIPLYRWQINKGNGFTDIANDTFFSGISEDTLLTNNLPTSWYGYKLRCKVIFNDVITMSQEYILKFQSIWNGMQDSDWNNPGNWNCGFVPDSHTDVFLSENIQHYPKLKSNVSIRSLYLQPGSSLEVIPGITLTVNNE